MHRLLDTRMKERAVTARYDALKEHTRELLGDVRLEASRLKTLQRSAFDFFFAESRL